MKNYEVEVTLTSTFEVYADSEWEAENNAIGEFCERVGELLDGASAEVIGYSEEDDE